jgi:Tol biopolymer transport system component
LAAGTRDAVGSRMRRLPAVAVLAAVAAALPACSLYLGEGDDDRPPDAGPWQPDAPYLPPDAPAWPDAAYPDAGLGDGGAPDAAAASDLEIAFVADRGGDGFLMQRNRRGEQREIAGPFGSMTDLAASPTGTHVAFASYEGVPRLRVVRVADGASHLVGTTGIGGPPSWSPDGTQLVYEGQAGGNAPPVVIRASLDGTDLESIGRASSGDWRCVAPVWSPDGREIAYASEGTLRVHTVATDAVRTIATARGACRPAWSPDGRVVAFTYGTDGSRRLGIVGSRGGAVRELVRLGIQGEQGRPSWAPDGRSIAFGDYDPAFGALALRQIRIGDSAASTLAEASGTAPVYWSSDGSGILYTRWSDGGGVGLWDAALQAPIRYFPGLPEPGIHDPVWLPAPIGPAGAP